MIETALGTSIAFTAPHRLATKAGFDILEGTHPIVPIMLYDNNLAKKMASEMLNNGIYVTGFYFPVVPRKKSRIRVQICATMQKKHLDLAISSFLNVGKSLGII